MIVVEVELPVEKVPGGSNAKRVAEDRRSTMRCWTQPYNLWTDGDRLVITVLCPVIESNLYAHPPSFGPRRKRATLSPNLLLSSYLNDVAKWCAIFRSLQCVPGFFGPTTTCNQQFSASRIANVGWFRADAV